MTVAAGIAALLVLVLTMLIVRRVTRPLHLGHALADGARQRPERRRDRLPRPADEIGEIARTVAVFKSNSLERGAHARASRPRPRPRRPSSARRICAGSSMSSAAGVGGIIDKVLNSSGEFERVARQLTDTARTTADLSAKSAGASEDGIRPRPFGGVSLRRAVPIRSPRSPAGCRNPTAICRRGGASRRRHRPAHRPTVGSRRPDRRRRQADHLDCGADQSAGAERDHRGGARRRCRARFCGGGPGGQDLAGQTAKATDEISTQIANMQLATEESVTRHQGDQRDHRAHQRHRELDLGCGRAAARRNPQHRGQRSRCGLGHRRCCGQCPPCRRGCQRDGRNLEPDVCLRPGAVRREPASEGRGREIPRPRAGGLIGDGGLKPRPAVT